MPSFKIEINKTFGDGDGDGMKIYMLRYVSSLGF